MIMDAMFPPWVAVERMLMLGMRVDVKRVAKMVLVVESLLYLAYHVRSFSIYVNQNVNVALTPMNRMDHCAWIHENQNQMIRCSSVYDEALANLQYV